MKPIPWVFLFHSTCIMSKFNLFYCQSFTVKCLEMFIFIAEASQFDTVSVQARKPIFCCNDVFFSVVMMYSFNFKLRICKLCNTSFSVHVCIWYACCVTPFLSLPFDQICFACVVFAEQYHGCGWINHENIMSRL